MTVVGFKFRSVRGIFLSLTLIVVFANDKKSVVQSPTNSSLQTNDNILRRIIMNRLSQELQVTSRNNYNEKNGETSREELKADYIKSMSDSMVDERRRDVANEDGTLRRRDRRNLERKRRYTEDYDERIETLQDEDDEHKMKRERMSQNEEDKQGSSTGLLVLIIFVMIFGLLLIASLVFIYRNRARLFPGKFPEQAVLLSDDKKKGDETKKGDEADKTKEDKDKKPDKEGGKAVKPEYEEEEADYYDVDVQTEANFDRPQRGRGRSPGGRRGRAGRGKSGGRGRDRGRGRGRSRGRPGMIPPGVSSADYDY